MKDFHGRIKVINPDLVYNLSAETAGKAKAELLRKARDAGYNVFMTDVQVRVGQWVTGVDVWLDRPERSGGGDNGSQKEQCQEAARDRQDEKGIRVAGGSQLQTGSKVLPFARARRTLPR